MDDACKHPAGISINSAICEEISQFCPNVNAGFHAYYTQISKSSEIYIFFSQCTLDIKWVGYNVIDTLKDNIDKNHISTRAELTSDWILLIFALKYMH